MHDLKSKLGRSICLNHDESVCLSGTLSNFFLRDEAASGFPKTTEEQKHSYKFPKKAARFVRESRHGSYSFVPYIFDATNSMESDKFHGKRQTQASIHLGIIFAVGGK